MLRALIFIYIFFHIPSQSLFVGGGGWWCRRHIADYNSRPADYRLLSLTYSPTVGFLGWWLEGRLKECAMFRDPWTYAIFLCPAMSLFSVLLFCSLLLLVSFIPSFFFLKKERERWRMPVAPYLICHTLPQSCNLLQPRYGIVTVGPSRSGPVQYVCCRSIDGLTKYWDIIVIEKKAVCCKKGQGSYRAVGPTRN